MESLDASQEPPFSIGAAVAGTPSLRRTEAKSEKPSWPLASMSTFAKALVSRAGFTSWRYCRAARKSGAFDGVALADAGSLDSSEANGPLGLATPVRSLRPLGTSRLRECWSCCCTSAEAPTNEARHGRSASARGETSVCAALYRGIPRLEFSG